MRNDRTQVLWEERPYGPPPVAPDVDAALARLVADAARVEDGDDASKLSEALAQAGLADAANDVIVYDFDDDEAQAARGTPAEEKYRALARDATRALVDKEVSGCVESNAGRPTPSTRRRPRDRAEQPNSLVDFHTAAARRRGRKST